MSGIYQQIKDARFMSAAISYSRSGKQNSKFKQASARKKVTAKRIKESLNRFLNGQGKNKGIKPEERYASFDFCYNYFYSFRKKSKDLRNKKNMQMSCLQIGFYLASWGMMRGSSFLLEKSVRNYSTLIKAISKKPSELWKIDVDEYDVKNIDLLIKCKEDIIVALGRENTRASDTLATKIMLGVFANVPAYDTYFKKFLKTTWKLGTKKRYCQTFNKTSLQQLNKFYADNIEVFNSFKPICTFNFSTGGKTKIKYKKAKLIDMCGFADGKPK